MLDCYPYAHPRADRQDMTRARTKAKATKAKATRPVARAKVEAPKKLSELKVANLKPKADRYEIADGQPGLRLRVFPSGAKSWCYLYRSPINRTWTRLTLGQYPALSVKAARRQASKAAAQVAEQTDPAAQKKNQRRALDIARRHTVSNVVDEFIERGVRALSSQMETRGGARPQNGNRADAGRTS